MKNYTLTSLLSLILLTMFSCSKPVDDQLSGFLLMGMYTVASQPEEVNNLLMNDQQTDGKNLIPGYKQIFEFPFTAATAQRSQAILMNDFQIDTNRKAIAKIDEYINKAEKSENKAFEYAIAANIANLSNSSGYFTKEENLEQNKRLLHETRKHYKEWTSYLKDFKNGRAKLNLDHQDRFEEVVDDILLKSESSPYLTLSL